MATYFFGSESHNTHSTTGERFAGLIQREVVARTDLVDLRCHRKTWDFLRRTRMPAVRMEAGYVSNAKDAQRLADPGFRDVLAEAVVVSVQRFYLSPEADAHTGFLRLSELRGGGGGGGRARGGSSCRPPGAELQREPDLPGSPGSAEPAPGRLPEIAPTRRPSAVSSSSRQVNVVLSSIRIRG